MKKSTSKRKTTNPEAKALAAQLLAAEKQLDHAKRRFHKAKTLVKHERKALKKAKIAARKLRKLVKKTSKLLPAKKTHKLKTPQAVNG
jgi:hypothetical protein